MAVYKLREGSIHEQFANSRAKIQLFGGGFGNGKTAAACVLKALVFAKDYPGSNGLIARATYPKLNDTIRKEFLKWCPANWIKSFPRSQNASNTCLLTNGTTINFRYIAQQGKNTTEATTSNLLSATYDWIVIDQVEDPEIVEKDFLDLLGRLRGMAQYIGNDLTMPRSGPRTIVLTTNPNRGWVYRSLVKPIHDFYKGVYNEKLLCETDEDGKPIIDPETKLPKPIIELFEGSTYENAENLEADFMKTLESAYRGQMRDRFLLGKWSAYEGLVYGEFNESIHLVQQKLMEQHLQATRAVAKVTFIEGFDYGIAVPSCYLLGFVDIDSNVHLIDGLYGNEQTIAEYAKKIKAIRDKYKVPEEQWMLTDPDLFRRGKSTTSKSIGQPISDLFHSEGIRCSRGANDILNGITKVAQYVAVIKHHKNPYTGEVGAPHLYVSAELEFFLNEISEYMWKRDLTGDSVDKPQDKNDHAMDALKYLMTNRPQIARIIPFVPRKPVGVQKWTEMDRQERDNAYRYG